MKHTIEYYYGLEIKEINIEQGVYHFRYNNDDYYFLPFLNRGNINDIIEYSKQLKANNIDCHDIILNIKKEPLTRIDEIDYLLMRVKDKDQIYNLFDMQDINKKINIKYHHQYTNNWAILWSKKIDYIEEQLNEIKMDSIVKLSIDYYLGLGETAIYYVNVINELFKDEVLIPTLAHKRIYYPNTKLNYLNPLSLIIDLEVRDVAEYLKAVFWAKEDAFEELKYYLKSKRLTPYLYHMLYVRLIYPSYYFDIYEKIVNQNESSNKIIMYLERTNEYEEFIKKAYQEISSYAKLLNIDYFK